MLTLIIVSAGASIFLLTVFLFGRQKGGGLKYQEEWIFSNFYVKIYNSLFEDKAPEYIATKLGVPYDRYMTNCRICRIEPDLVTEVSRRIISLVILGLSFLLVFLLQSIAIAIIGIALFYLLFFHRTAGVQRKANKRKKAMLDQLPRFIDLFQTALTVGLPVESAIEITAKEITCIVSDELKLAAAETKLGAKSWQRALEDVALMYQVDAFSDFVLNLTTAYEKGIPITDVVARKSAEIKQINLLDAKERSAKLSNTILLPVMIFKVIPLLAIMLIPIVQQISNM